MLAMTLTEPPQRPQTSMSILNTRFRRWAQVMPDKAGQALAAWRSAGVRTSALEIDLMPFPRLAGVTSPGVWRGSANSNPGTGPGHHQAGSVPPEVQLRANAYLPGGRNDSFVRPTLLWSFGDWWKLRVWPKGNGSRLAGEGVLLRVAPVCGSGHDSRPEGSPGETATVCLPGSIAFPKAAPLFSGKHLVDWNPLPALVRLMACPFLPWRK